MRTLVVFAVATYVTGCAVSQAATVTVSKDLAADCARHCTALDMRLAAVVVVANQGGCVCEPKAAPGSEAPRAGGAAASGGAVVAIEQANQQQHKQQQTMTPSTPPAPTPPHY